MVVDPAPQVLLLVVVVVRVLLENSFLILKITAEAAMEVLEFSRQLLVL
jgi:hypothetical protein